MTVKAGPNIVTDGLVFNLDPANVKSYPAKNDSYRDQVSLLLDGASFTDKSRNNYTITANGNVSISNAVQLFGNDTIYFDGNGDYLSTAGSALPSGTGDFTIEGWFNSIRGWQFNSNQTYNFIEGAVGSSVMSFFHAYYNGTGQVKLANNSNGIGVTFDPSVYNMQPNTWYHIAVTRSSGTVRLFLNGALVSSGSLTTNFGTTATTYIGGAARSASLSFYGYIGYLAVTNNVARYTSNFTPPLSFSVPTRITDTKGKSVGTLTNGPVFSNNQGGVMSFDGSNDYINFDTSSLLTDNATISFWINTNSTESQYVNYVFSMGNSGSQNFAVNVGGTYSDYRTPARSIGLFVNSSFYSSAVENAFTTTDYNKWNHICLVYEYSSGVKIYKNGVLLSMFSNEVVSKTITAQNKIDIARRSDGQFYFNGQLSNIKLYNRPLSYDEVLKDYNSFKSRFLEYRNSGLVGQKYSGYYADNVNYFLTATKTGSPSLFTTIDTGSPPWNIGDYYSYEWTGYFKPSTTETYTFYTYSDDASHLWIGDNALSGYTTANALINNGGVHGAREYSGSIALTAGLYYPIRIQFGENAGGDVIRVSFSTPTISKTSNGSGYYFS